MNAAAHQDKICPKLQEDMTRNKILSRMLKESKCDSKEVHDFLKLLKKPSFNPN